MGYRSTQNVPFHRYLYEVSVAPYRPYSKENFHIFKKGLAKKHFHKYVMPNGSTAWLYKSKHFSFTDNTHWGIAT